MAIKAIQDFVQGDIFKVKIRHNPIIDITGGVFILALNKTESGSTPELLVQVTAPAGADATNGIVYIPVDKTKSAAVPPGRYYVSIKRIITGDETTIVRTGLYNIDKVNVFKNLAGSVV